MEKNERRFFKLQNISDTPPADDTENADGDAGEDPKAHPSCSGSGRIGTRVGMRREGVVIEWPNG